jgi:YHS domain-containing protein
MEVDEGAARAKGWTAEHGGKTYFFCNPMCRESFAKDPASFLGKGKGAGGMGKMHGTGGSGR